MAQNLNSPNDEFAMQDDTMWLLEFGKAHARVNHTDGSFASNVGAKILAYDYPDDIKNKDIVNRIDFWLANAKASVEEQGVAKDFKTFIKNDGVLPKAQIIDAGDVGGLKTNPGHAGAKEEAPKGGPEGIARGTTELAGAVVGTIGSGLKSLAGGIVAPFAGAKAMLVTKLAQSRIESHTDKSINGMQQMHDLSSKEVLELRQQVIKLKATPAGPERDALTDSIAGKAGDIRDKIKESAETQSRLNADPTVDAKFKRSEDDIKEDAEEVTGKVGKLLAAAHAHLGDDTANTDKIKAAQEQLAEMLERVKKFIQSMFQGFVGTKRAPSSSAPRPS